MNQAKDPSTSTGSVNICSPILYGFCKHMLTVNLANPEHETCRRNSSLVGRGLSLNLIHVRRRARAHARARATKNEDTPRQSKVVRSAYEP